MPHFSGRVVSVVYENSEFYVLRVSLDDKSVLLPAAVRGNFPSVQIRPGTWLSFEGNWEEHSAYGKQITVLRFPVAPPTWTVQSVLSVLSSEGIGPTVCQNLKSMGDGLHSSLNEGPDALISTGLDAFTREHVIAKWRMAISHLKSTSFLQDAGVPQKILSKVWAVLGDRAEEILTRDPWSLLQVDGITFQQADEVATRLGLPLDTPLRTRGAALAALKKARSEGNLYLTPPDLSEAARNLAPSSPFLSGDTLVDELQKEGLAKLISVDGVQAVYEPWALHLEEDSSDRLLTRGASSEIRGDREQALREVEDWSSIHHVTLTPNQQLAAINALTEPVSILTGLPGTGKTTTLRAVVQILIERRVSFLLCAPTGIAAKRMASVTGAPAATIHRAFGARGFDTGDEREANYSGIVGDKTQSAASSKPGFGEKWACTPKDPHRAKVVICDESSMLDQHLLYRILSGTSQDCRLVFVGDAAQLPSVGPGDVLRNLISSGKFPTVSLTDIFRQQDTSGIVVAAHDIFRGRAPTSDGKDFVIVEAQEEEVAAATIQRISERLYGARANFQVLSPRHAGAAGVTLLNQRLRNALNPAVSGLAEIRLGAETVREDDRVMVVKNDYNLDVYNGDVGKVSRIDRKSREIEITLYNESPPRLVRIPFSDASGKLRLAYAQTVHKSQGQEYDIIVVPILPSFTLQLQRNLYYTAVTRAKKKAILVGTYQALCRAVANDKAEKRNTLLSLRLSSPELFEGGSSQSEDA